MIKKLRQIIPAREKPLGPGQSVFSPLPHPDLGETSPFLMLDHFGPKEVSLEKPFHVPPHPHKGFEPVTLLFQGEVLHRDSLGNTGHLRAGDVQWMTAGSGVVHSEGVPPAFLEKGGKLELIQLWINLPAKEKSHPPRYQDLRSEQFPLVQAGDAVLKLIAGSYSSSHSPTQLLTPVLILHGRMEKGGRSAVIIPDGYNVLAYVLSGQLQSDNKTAVERTLMVFGIESGAIELHAVEDATFVILAGLPIHEPVASYGPFVMNTRAELIDAVEEYQSGKMGTLEE